MKKARGTLSLFLLAFLFSASCTGVQVVHDFSSDGCSLFPDGSIQKRGLWCSCCFDHDIAYWRGGTEEERLQADQTLRECVFRKTGDRALAEMMFEGVRFGGQPVFPNWYRWGYGWNYGRGYTPLTDREKAVVAERMKSYWQNNPQGYCDKGNSNRTKASQDAPPGMLAEFIESKACK